MEHAGIPTLSIYVKAFRHVAEEMGLSRVVVTPYLMGRPLGPPGDVLGQRAIVDTALDLLETADGPRTIVEMPARDGNERPSLHKRGRY